MSKKIDLHSHTTISDGELSVSELIDEAIARDVGILAITDHDTVAGIETALEYVKEKEINIVSGIEISCDEKDLGFRDVHIIGLFIDHKNRDLLAFCESVKEARINQKRKIIKKLQEFHFDISFEEVEKTTKVTFARPHIARVLVQKYPDEFPDVQSVFEKYIGNGKPAYVPREDKVSIKKAIELIHGAGGVPILAHPGVFKINDAKILIKHFIECGGEGLETFYAYHLVLKPDIHSPMTKEEADKLNEVFKEIAKENNLVFSGGSDFHGSIRKTRLGCVDIPSEVMMSLKERIQKK